MRNAVISLPDVGKDLNRAIVHFYDPWSNRWIKGDVERNRITLPDFARSLVIKIRL